MIFKLKTSIMKNAFFITALSLVGSLAHAQKSHSYSAHTEFGVKAGLNVSNVSVESSTNPDSKASVNIGVLAHIHLDRQFAFQPELLFSGQGYKYTVSGTTINVPLNYLTLPLLGQFMFGDGFRVETGPQPGVLVSAHAKANGNSTSIKDSYKTFDLSWAFGAGYLTKSGFGIDVRYNLGLSNINDASSAKIHNRVFAVGAFYQFHH